MKKMISIVIVAVLLASTLLLPKVYKCTDTSVSVGSCNITSSDVTVSIGETNETSEQASEIKCVQWYPEIPYSSPNATASLYELKAAIPNCTYLQLKCEVNTTVDTVTAQTDTSTLTDALSVARPFGYKIILRIQMSDARLFAPTNADAWFTSYTEVVKQYAILAQNQNIEGFCIACEFTMLEMPQYNSYWDNMITQLRAVYNGRLWYETNYWPYSDDYALANYNSTKCLAQKLSLTWLSRLDCIAVSTYWEVGGRPQATVHVPTVQELVYGWNNYRSVQGGSYPSMWIESPVADLNNLSQTFGKKILIVSGLISAESASTQPWQPPDYYPNITQPSQDDLTEQANWYEALFRVFHGQSWVAGFEFDVAWSTRPDHPIKKESFLEGKPAQDIVETWFTRSWAPEIPGDLNGDSKVGLADLVILANAYGAKPFDAKWNPDADINGDGVVDQTDLVIMALHYGQHYP